MKHIHLSDDLIKEFLIEASTTVNGNLDDGPSTFHKDYSEYVKVSTEWIDSLYSDAGWANGLYNKRWC